MKTLTTWLVVLLAAQALAEPELLTLDEALRLARQSHPLTQQAVANVGIMQSRVEQTRGVLLPQLNAAAQYTRQHVGASTGSIFFAPFTANSFSVGLSATQIIWDFGAIERYRAAGFTREAQEATERAVELQIALGVRRAYFAAAAQVALVRVAEDTAKNLELHLQQVKALVISGQRTSIDTAQAQTALAQANLQRINARNGLHLAMATLTQAVGTLHPKSWKVDEQQLGPIENEEDQVDALVQLALEQRPELASFHRQQEAIAASQLAVKGGYLPTLGATGAVSEAGVAIDRLGTNWSFGVGLSWNLFNGGQTTGLLHESQYTADLLNAQLDVELLQVRVDVEQARLTIEDERSAVEAAGVAVDAARAQLTLAEGRLKAGIGTVLELDDAQVQFTNASAQLVQAKLTLSTARASLLAALGVDR